MRWTTCRCRHSEYFRRQIYACFWFEQQDVSHTLELIGSDNILFETDFPHPTCLYPDSMAAAAPGLAALGPGRAPKGAAGQRGAPLPHRHTGVTGTHSTDTEGATMSASPPGAEQPVVIERAAPHVSVIRLNRPARLNALNFPMVADLHDALDTVAADDTCKVVVLTGAGRGFCSGLDLRDFGRPPAPGSHRWFPAGRTGQAFMSDLTQHLRATPQIVVAAINGPAVGGGLAIALACDLRVASSSARLCAAFIRTGLTGTDIGISYLLPRLIGASRAFDLMVTGRTIDAAEAERMGIVSQVFAAEDLARGGRARRRPSPGTPRTACATPRKSCGTTSSAPMARGHRDGEPQPGPRPVRSGGAAVHERLRRRHHPPVTGVDRRLTHVEMLYRPGERRLARRIFELLGCEPVDRGGTFLTSFVDPRGPRDYATNVVYASEVEPAQWEWEGRLMAAAADEARTAYLAQLRRRPQRSTHFGFRVTEQRELEEIVTRVRAAGENDPELAGRVAVDGVYRPGDPGALADTMVQAFVWTDVVAAGPLTLGQHIEVQWHLTG